jgi:hypothetical protein
MREEVEVENDERKMPDGEKKKKRNSLVPFPLFVEEVLHVPVGDHDGLLEVVEHCCRFRVCLCVFRSEKRRDG